MPFESEKQRKAMYAAAKSKSNIGIPKEVAKKFIKHGEDELSAPVLLTPKKFAENAKVEEEIADPREELQNVQGEIAEIAKILRAYKTDTLLDKVKTMNENEIMVRAGEPVPRFGQDADPCWEGYQQIGMKEKGGKEVPNCVPDSAVEGSVVAVDEKPIDKMAGAEGRASGILFLTESNETLLVRRGNGGDYPNMWCVPGGHQIEGETLEDCARREAAEETGRRYEGDLEILHDDGQFCTYIARDIKKFPVKVCDESTGYDWSHLSNPPMPLHPGLATAFRVAAAKTEYDIAELIKDDVLPSPQMYANICLLAIRITGTGLAYRSSIGEHVWRDPSLYLNEEFLKRCNGLTVIMDHPESAVLTSKEFKDRAVGSIMLPYIKGDEVWGIAKIYDQASVDEILEGEISTSPSVVFDQSAGNTTLTTESGEPLLIEGVPFLLDHIAIVTKARGSKGVWDKGGEATGVLLTNQEVS